MLEGKELHDALKEFEEKSIKEQEEEDLRMLQEEINKIFMFGS